MGASDRRTSFYNAGVKLVVGVTERNRLWPLPSQPNLRGGRFLLRILIPTAG